MKKIALEIVALSHSITQSHSYAVVLGEVDGTRRLPIVIGSFEAQAIAVALEKMVPSRPLTHDLMKNIMTDSGIVLHEIIINHLQEGVFYSKLICSNTNNDIIEIDSRTSDALALAVRFGCPIYTYGTILDDAGILIKEEKSSGRRKSRSSKPLEETIEESPNNDLKTLTLQELQILLDDAVNQEDYIKARDIKKEIDERTKK